MKNKPWSTNEVNKLKQFQNQKTVEEAAFLLNRSINSVYTKARNLNIKLKPKSNPKNKTTLCWICAKATGRCNWSIKFEPVIGWRATSTIVNQTYSKDEPSVFVESYEVHSCPEFLPDEKETGINNIQNFMGIVI